MPTLWPSLALLLVGCEVSLIPEKIDQEIRLEQDGGVYEEPEYIRVPEEGKPKVKEAPKLQLPIPDPGRRRTRRQILV